MRYCIKGGNIINPAGDFNGLGDVLIDAGKIVAVGAKLEADGAQVVSATGKMVFPGFIDLHCHLREPGREDEETIASGTRAAIKGGFTAVACMANTLPVADNPYIIRYIIDQAQQAGSAKVYPIGAITKGLKGEELAELGEMAAAGAVAFSDDGKTLMNGEILRLALEYSAMFERPLFLHQEDPDLAGNGVMHEGYWSTVLGLPGIPEVAETAVIARDLAIAEYTGGRVHFCHISTAAGVRLIRAAQQRGVKVTAEATPHHLTFTDASADNFDPDFRVSPPLRAEADRTALRQGVADGTIQVIATDHAPHSLEEKHREFSLAPTGMIGLETALAVIWTELIVNKLITPEQLVERMSLAPAEILQVPGGKLQAGAPADVIIFDPNEQWEVLQSELISKSKNTPFKGRQLLGKVDSVWVDGDLKLINQKFAE